MELTLLQRAEEAERATTADEFRIISEAALAVFGWQDERYKRVIRLLEAGASLDAAMTFYAALRDRFRLRDLCDWGHNWSVGLDWLERKYGHIDVEAKTAPLALTAASLRALAQQKDPSHG